MSPQSEDDIELYRNITSTSTIPCTCCLFFRHNAITRYHLYSLSKAPQVAKASQVAKALQVGKAPKVAKTH